VTHGKSAYLPGQTDPYPGKKEQKNNLNNKQVAENKRHLGKRTGCLELWRVGEEKSPHEL
jgi:hypothetical protein